MRSTYKIYDKEGVYFVTSTTVEWIPIFTRKKYFEIIIQSLTFCRKNKGLRIYAFIIMDNHIHMIVSGQNLSQTMKEFKSFTATEIIKVSRQDNRQWLLNQLEFYKKKHKNNSTHQVWQEGFHPKQMTSDEMLSQKVDYIHYNPVEAGFVKKAEDWIYSSASNYILGKGVIEIDLFGE